MAILVFLVRKWCKWPKAVQVVQNDQIYQTSIVPSSLKNLGPKCINMTRHFAPQTKWRVILSHPCASKMTDIAMMVILRPENNQNAF